MAPGAEPAAGAAEISAEDAEVTRVAQLREAAAVIGRLKVEVRMRFVRNLPAKDSADLLDLPFQGTQRPAPSR